MRSRQQRNLLATMFLSQGVPMLVAGDELGRTQRGNNNAYCQDNELSWIDWAQADEALLAFTASARSKLVGHVDGTESIEGYNHGQLLVTWGDVEESKAPIRSSRTCALNAVSSTVKFHV